MRVAINALCIGNQSGTGRYAFGLIDGLAKIKISDMHVSAFLPSDFILPKRWEQSANMRFYRVPIHGAIRRIVWEQTQLSRLCEAINVDLLHSPAFTAPVFKAPSCRQIATIHDLAFLRFPDTLPWGRRNYLRWIMNQVVNKADAVICDSNTVAWEIEHHFNLKRAPRAIHLGIDPDTFNPGPEPSDAAVIQANRLPENYFLFVGAIEPRKNVSTLSHAFEQARQNGLSSQLAIVGRKGWNVESETLEKPGILRIGYAPEQSLPALYRNARAYLAPSIYEGFDLPCAEALACGTPVIASAMDVHQEVFANHAQFIDARDASAWADALLKAEKEPKPSQAVLSRTWLDVARETADEYRAILC